MKNLSQKQITKLENQIQGQLKGYFGECVRINELVKDPTLDVNLQGSLEKTRKSFKEKLEDTIKQFLKDENLNLDAVPELNQLLKDFQNIQPAIAIVDEKRSGAAREEKHSGGIEDEARGALLRLARTKQQIAAEVTKILSAPAMKLALAKSKLSSDIDDAANQIEKLAVDKKNKSKRSMFDSDSVCKKIGKKLLLGVAGVMIAAAVFYGLSFTPVGAYVTSLGSSALPNAVSTVSSWGSSALSTMSNAMVSPATMAKITTALPHIDTSISGLTNSISATVAPLFSSIGSSLPSATPLINMLTTNTAPVLSAIPSSMQSGAALVTAAASCFTGAVGVKAIAKAYEKPALLEEQVSKYSKKLMTDARNIAMEL